MIVRPGVAAALALIAAGCTRQIEQAQVKRALVDAGVAPPVAQCLAHRLARQLTAGQLRKLQALQGARETIDDYLVAVERVNDPEALRVAIDSAARCVSPQAP